MVLSRPLPAKRFTPVPKPSSTVCPIHCMPKPATKVLMCARCAPGLPRASFMMSPARATWWINFQNICGLEAKPVAQLGFDAVMRGDVICVPGTANKITALMAKWMPLKSVVRSMAKRAKNFPQRKTGLRGLCFPAQVMGTGLECFHCAVRSLHRYAGSGWWRFSKPHSTFL